MDKEAAIKFFTDNPHTAPATVRERFGYPVGPAIYNARDTAKRRSRAQKREASKNGVAGGHTFKSGEGWITETAKPETVDHIQWHNNIEALSEGTPTPPYAAPTPPPSLFSWADFGLWMDREQLRGFLRGRAVEYLTKGDKLSVEEALRCVTTLAELTD